MPEYCIRPTREQLRQAINKHNWIETERNLEALLKPVALASGPCGCILQHVSTVSWAGDKIQFAQECDIHKAVRMSRESMAKEVNRLLAIERVDQALIEDAKDAWSIAEDIDHDGLYGVKFELLKALKKVMETER